MSPMSRGFFFLPSQLKHGINVKAFSQYFVVFRVDFVAFLILLTRQNFNLVRFYAKTSWISITIPKNQAHWTKRTQITFPCVIRHEIVNGNSSLMLETENDERFFFQYFYVLLFLAKSNFSWDSNRKMKINFLSLRNSRKFSESNLSCALCNLVLSPPWSDVDVKLMRGNLLRKQEEGRRRFCSNILLSFHHPNNTNARNTIMMKLTRQLCNRTAEKRLRLLRKKRLLAAVYRITWKAA